MKGNKFHFYRWVWPKSIWTLFGGEIGLHWGFIKTPKPGILNVIGEKQSEEDYWRRQYEKVCAINKELRTKLEEYQRILNE